MMIKCSYRDMKFQSFPLYTCVILNELFTAENYELCCKENSTKKYEAKALCIGYSTIKTSLKSLFSAFSNVTHLEITRSNLTDLGFEDVQDMISLYSINLEGNRIRKPNATLLMLPYLGRLSYNSNCLQEIDQDFMDQLEDSKIIFLDLRNNPGIHQVFKSSSTSNVLQKLNNYQRGQPTILDQLKYLENLNEKLFESGEYSDFKIIIDDREFNVHKAVLAAGSSVFAAMFRCKMKESIENQLLVEDSTPEVMTEFLRFIYTGKHPEDDVDFMGIFEMSKFYIIMDLMDYCESKITSSVNPENAFDVYQFANLHSCQRMKEVAFENVRKFLGFKIVQSLINEPGLVAAFVGVKRSLIDVEN